MMTVVISKSLFQTFLHLFSFCINQNTGLKSFWMHRILSKCLFSSTWTCQLKAKNCVEDMIQIIALPALELSSSSSSCCFLPIHLQTKVEVMHKCRIMHLPVILPAFLSLHGKKTGPNKYVTIKCLGFYEMLSSHGCLEQFNSTSIASSEELAKPWSELQNWKRVIFCDHLFSSSIVLHVITFKSIINLVWPLLPLVLILTSEWQLDLFYFLIWFPL